MLVWNVARSLKLSIPEDIKLIGYDGTSFIESYYPQLTTIKQPLVEIARLLVDLLIDKIEGKKTPKNRLYFTNHPFSWRECIKKTVLELTSSTVFFTFHSSTIKEETLFIFFFINWLSTPLTNLADASSENSLASSTASLTAITTLAFLQNIKFQIILIA